MIDSISHIISPLSAPWCGWVLFGLLLCAVLSEYMQPGIVRLAYVSLIARSERTYKDAPVNLYGQILIFLFRLGTLAMGISICLYNGSTFSIAVFGIVFGLVLATLLVKLLCNKWLDYTFSLSRRYMPMHEQYGDLSTIACTFLFLGIMIVMHTGRLALAPWILGGATALFVLMCLYRVTLHYVQSPMGMLYVLIYIVSLEVLPLGVLYFLCSKTIASL
jgi:hypothetical protein